MKRNAERSAFHSGMEEQEALRHMMAISHRHEINRKKRSSTVRNLHWSTYLGLQIIRIRLSRAPAAIISMIPASLWIFDNYYLLYREIKKFQETGGSVRYRRLPVIKTGSLRAQPRVYVLAREIMAACNRHLDEDTVVNMLKSYQQVNELTTEELWAFQNLLSLALLEDIITETGRIVEVIKSKKLAENKIKNLTDRILHRDLKLADLLADEISREEMKDLPFLAHIILRLRSLSVEDQEIEEWLNKRSPVNSTGFSENLSGIVSEEGQQEAVVEAHISTLITSLKTISDLNWENVFLKISPLDAVLNHDPVGMYSGMSEETKSQYRRVIEKLANKHDLLESNIAQKVIELAQRNISGAKPEKIAHVGFFLLDEGYYGLVKYIAQRKTYLRTLRNLGKIVSKLAYFCGIVFVTALVLFLFNNLFLQRSEISLLSRVILLLLTLIPASDTAIYLANNLSTRLIKPKPLPAMNYEKIIPDNCRTFVVIPVIINDPQQIARYAQRLEKYYLVNRQNNLYFALLADYFDASTQSTPEDKAIMNSGIKIINELNQKYNQDRPRFFLFFRPRKWNEVEKSWMGWERKRGKIEAFNTLLTNKKTNNIEMIVGDEEALSDVRFVITLDADTELLRDGAAQLISIMDHPLNKPVYNSTKKRITEGYVIVQSEIRARLSSSRSSIFASFFSGQAGLDPYATRVSDVYQDLFDEGIYAGKGIYDVKIFSRFLDGVIPDNSVLSHDLLEGSLSRCAFASGIKLMDSWPATVAAYTKREHRWIRGDWQLLPWILARSSINGLSRWKMIDNLRRSLSRPALLLLIVGNAILLPEYSWTWLFFFLFEPIIHALSVIFFVLWRKIVNPTLRLAKIVILEQLTTIVMQTILGFILLPYRAYIAIDAIIRTLYRLIFSHKNLLEWQTAEQVERKQQNSPTYYWRLMWPSVLPASAVIYALTEMIKQPFTIVWAVVAVFWGTSPWFAYLFSRRRSKTKKNRQISSADVNKLRLTARRTWRFFEDYTSVDTHWLCPDNFQEHPGPKVSNKTSPTNIGLQLLSLLSARDMGYISLYRLIGQCENVIDTITSLPKWKGHLYNWYNIKTLQVLNPRYISTVDSGNYFAHLFVLKQGLLEQKSRPVISQAYLQGLRDTCQLAGIPNELLLEEFNDISSIRKDIETLLSWNQAADESQTEWLEKVGNTCQELLDDVNTFMLEGRIDEQKALQKLADSGNEEAKQLIRKIDKLVAALDKLTSDADFSFLYDSRVQQFFIGYNVAAQKADSGHYDLLASEARLTSFLAIAAGTIPQKHWFALGRPLTVIKGIPACVSWSGSMFEYLMPNLVMKCPAGSVLQQSCIAAVLQQIRYGSKNKMPWGISESQHYRFDTDANYQYGPFGVSKLRLQASLRPVRVITPYATMLSLMVLPAKALKNLAILRSIGGESDHGFYEALDFNQPDTDQLRPFSLVRSFMAHHQGMSLVAINNFLNQDIMPTRFHREPIVRASEVLLEEKRNSGIVTLARLGYTINMSVSEMDEEQIEHRTTSQINLKRPLVHILSNNSYMVLLTSDGAGFSRCHDFYVNRWQPEKPVNQGGQFIYLRNINTGQVWSSTYLPTQVKPDEYQAVFSHCEAEYTRRDGFIQTYTKITISPADNLEIRKVSLSNNGSQDAVIELTSYFEAVADTFIADALHPAFSKLFIETEFVADRNMLIASRRKREDDDPTRIIMHAVLPDTELMHPVNFETDRKNFIGRGGSIEDPAVIRSGQPMTSRDGFSRDTILSLRAVVKVPAGKTASVSFVSGYFQNREDVFRISYELRKPHSVDDISKLAITRSKLELKYLNITSHQQNAILNLATNLFWPARMSGADKEALSRLKLGQSNLWRFGISGDYPIIVLRAGDLKNLPNVQEVLLAYEYLRLKQVKADLVIINEEPVGYAWELEHRIRDLIASLRTFSKNENGPGLFLLQRSNMSDDEFNLILSVARINLSGKSGLYSQYTKSGRLSSERKDDSSDDKVILLPPGKMLPEESKKQAGSVYDTSNLEFYNGYGGFGAAGKEYVIVHGGDKVTPRPWINVIANDNFGFHISETGAGYTWYDNSRENKLTTWSNDPVLDPVSESVYIRDENNQGITSPASLYPGHDGSYKVRHGFGYSVFAHEELELEQEMTVFVCKKDPVKIWLLEIKNNADYARKITVTLYVEWVLGVIRHQEAPYIETDFSREDELFTACNNYNDIYRSKPAFVFSSEPVVQYTGDRMSFLGIGGSCKYPFALSDNDIPCKIGAGLDPCAVIQISLEIDAHETRQFCFGLGQTASYQKAKHLADRYRKLSKVNSELEGVKAEWAQKLGMISVHTPDRALDILVNGWLLYQVISCRLKAKSAFYQCGGAVGFRDQLQDVMALMDIDPSRVRRQLIICSSRQFVEGDVQHWWHATNNVGVRTRITDDLLWLPYITAEYVRKTGDYSILDVEVPFLQARSLEDDEAEAILPTVVTKEKESVYQHCLRAIDKALKFGDHGLPLMGGGDWNDGMNRIGIHGRGESVWLGFFQYSVLQKFLPLARHQGDVILADQLSETADSIQENIERHAWDGEWYMRAFFDDGSPVGSKTCDECRIDSISQSWSVLSQCAGKIRSLTAIDSARRHLVREEDRLSLLLTPPFNKTVKDPGYIKGYYPGIRENGGQYTHGAIWLAMAFARLKKGNEAGQLLTMLNPIHSTSVTPAAVKYENEPYVMSADISIGDNNAGKAGWSWYTGSAGWMYQLIVQDFLGLKREKNILSLNPSVPEDYKRYVIEYKFGSSLYEITVINEPGHDKKQLLTVDGNVMQDSGFKLVDDGNVHSVIYKHTVR